MDSGISLKKKRGLKDSMHHLSHIRRKGGRGRGRRQKKETREPAKAACRSVAAGEQELGLQEQGSSQGGDGSKKKGESVGKLGAGQRSKVIGRKGKLNQTHLYHLKKPSPDLPQATATVSEPRALGERK